MQNVLMQTQTKKCTNEISLRHVTNAITPMNNIN